MRTIIIMNNLNFLFRAFLKFLQQKDHKKELKTRQVVSGCDSNTVGLRNIMSDLVESIANAVENSNKNHKY